jgi:histone H3/H4
MKNSVPTTSKISKEAKEAVQECLSEFISFVTSEAAEKCQDEKRKTIGGEDVLYAMLLLGLDQYVEPLKIHLAKMRMVRFFFYSSTHERSLTVKDCHYYSSLRTHRPTRLMLMFRMKMIKQRRHFHDDEFFYFSSGIEMIGDWQANDRRRPLSM